MTIRIENNDESYDIDILKKIEVGKLKNEKNIQIIINNDLKLTRVETECLESCMSLIGKDSKEGPKEGA